MRYNQIKEHNVFKTGIRSVKPKKKDDFGGDLDFSIDEFDLDISDVPLSDFDKLVFVPNYVTIEDSTKVDLVKDGSVIMSDEWGNVLDFIDKNFRKLNGKYDISEKGMSLFDFTIVN